MGRFGDKYVTSILCDGKVIVDNQCFMHTPKIFIDEAITVSIGGDVNMAATTIDFRNSTIDFNGATLENFTGNISGNISGNLTVDSVSALVISAYAFFGNLYGNVTGTYINGDHITSSIGLHGTLFTSSIVEKNIGRGCHSYRGSQRQHIRFTHRQRHRRNQNKPHTTTIRNHHHHTSYQHKRNQQFYSQRNSDIQ